MFSFLCRQFRLVECPGHVCVRGNRVFARRPVRVHIKGATKEVEDTVRHYEEMVTNQRNHTKASSARREHQKNEHYEQKIPAASPDPNALLRNSIRYKPLSEAKEYVRKLLQNTKSQKYRNEHQLFVAEGYRIIREALEHKVTPEAIYFTRLNLVASLRAAPTKLELEDVHALCDLPLYKAPYKKLQTWSSVTSSPGIIGVFRVPTAFEPHNQPTTTTTTTTTTTNNSLPLTLVLDELREPGNLGGILRTAAAVGVHQVFLMKGCCDPWETKVVKAGCGAHFRLRLYSKLTWDKLCNYMPEDTQVFLADVQRGEDIVVGEREEVEVATTQKAEEETDVIDDLEDNVYELDEEGNKVMLDHSYNDPQHLELYQHVSLPMRRYDQLGLAWAVGGAMLVIGGEVGISNAAKKFVAENFGSKVTVPLTNGMDSLNVGVASGIILYEMQKQLYEIAAKSLSKERHKSGS